MTPQNQSKAIRAIAAQVNVIPIVVLDDAAHARPLAEALVAGGLPVIEVTLRTPAALDAIRVMATVPGATVGAGTLLTPKDAHAAKVAGAQFGVSPGCTPHLAEAVTIENLPLLPGAATASEVMALWQHGYDVAKFFPAEMYGGTEALKSIGAPIPQVAFCPTGGVTSQNAPAYLRLANVMCVGGSWITPKDKIVAGDWAGIEALAREAAALSPHE